MLNPFSSRIHCWLPLKLIVIRALARRAASRTTMMLSGCPFCCDPLNSRLYLWYGVWVGPNPMPT
jgi:hypothetical protein